MHHCVVVHLICGIPKAPPHYIQTGRQMVITVAVILRGQSRVGTKPGTSPAPRRSLKLQINQSICPVYACACGPLDAGLRLISTVKPEAAKHYGLYDDDDDCRLGYLPATFPVRYHSSSHRVNLSPRAVPFV